MTKATKWHVRPAKTQISLGIHPVWSVFAVRMNKAWFLSYPVSTQRRLWSDWADAQADLSLRWANSHFVGFVMRWLISQNLDPPLSWNKCWILMGVGLPKGISSPWVIESGKDFCLQIFVEYTYRQQRILKFGHPVTWWETADCRPVHQGPLSK